MMRSLHILCAVIVAILALAVMVTTSGLLSAQTTEPPVADTLANPETPSHSDESEPEQATAMKEKKLDETRMDTATDVELQRRFNELERKLLDDKTKSADRWLNAITISLTVIIVVLTIIGIVIGVIGYLGYSQFKEEARRLLDEIKEHRDTAGEMITAMNAEKVRDDPSAARQVVQNIRENPQATFVEKAVADAVSLQQQGRNEEAIERWRSIANIVEGNDNDLAARAWFSVGYLFREESLKTTEKPNAQEVLSAYDKAIRLKPDYAEAYDNRGITKSRLGQYEAAIADHSEAIRLKPNLAGAYNNRGVAKNALGQREAAIADYDEAIRLKPGLAKVYNNRGSTKNALGRHEAAIADYDEAIRLKPDYAEAYTNRGIVKNALGQHEAAIADHSEAIRLKPDYALAYGNRGSNKAALGRMDEARQDFETALALAREAGDKNLVVKAERALENLNKGEVQ